MDKATQEVALILKARGLSAKDTHARLEATYRPCKLAEVETLFGAKPAPKAKAKAKKK